tara:strand:- start:6609 stop:7178 length:570 start_codon:yes stop_codon:yes gene_type:complete
MSLSFPLTFPSVGISNFDLRYRKSVAVSESPFTYAQQVHDFGGGRWEAEVSLAPLTFAEARSIDAFFIGLEGRKGTFLMGHPLHTASGSADVDNESIGAFNIDLDGADAFPAGTYFSIANHLYMLTSAKASGSNQSVEIQPPLRTDTTTNTSLDFTNPLGVWRLSTNDVNSHTDVNGLFYYSFSCTEAI